MLHFSWPKLSPLALTRTAAVGASDILSSNGKSVPKLGESLSIVP
jgi:hypothetical protein